MRFPAILAMGVAVAACGGDAKPKTEAAPPAPPAAAPAPDSAAAKADTAPAKAGQGKLPPAAKAAAGMMRDSAIKPIGAVDDKGKVTPLKKP